MKKKDYLFLEDEFYEIRNTLEEVNYLNNSLMLSAELKETDFSYTEDLTELVRLNTHITEKLLKEMSDKISKAETELLKKVALTENE